MARKSAQTRLTPKLISIAVASCFATGVALANPTGPTVVNGTAAILQNGNLLQITNSPNAIINWRSFSIGVNEITRFIQQSQASAVLNRVTGAGGAIDPSVILGVLQSNGRVFLINPSGILFGAGAQIDVAGLVATSLNLSNADFLANRLKFTDVPGAGSVINQGNVTAGAGGNVYLIGPAVTNSGIITSPQGEVILAAGNSVELVNPGTPNLRVEITAPDNQALNLGQVVADSGRVGIYAGLIRNAGTISADGVVSEGGRILLKATRNVTLDNSSVLSAQGQGGGEIKVLGGEKVDVAGRLDASAPNGGDGGFIETSAVHVKFGPSTFVTTSAPFGKTGTWLIDPPDFTIAATGGDLTGLQLSGAGYLADNNVVISSNDGTVNPLGSGDIFVNDAVLWSNANSLTLTAFRDVQVNNPVTNGGTGAINFNAGRDVSINGVGISTAGSVGVTASGGLRILAGSTAGQHAELIAGAGQTVSAGYVEVIAQADNEAMLRNNGGTQSITTSNTNAAGEGVLVRNLGGTTNLARIYNNSAGPQSITVNDAGRLVVDGTGWSARILANGDQTILVQGAASANAIEVGSTGALGSSRIEGNNQQITAGTSGQLGSITLRGPAGTGKVTYIETNTGTQTVSTTGALQLIGGTSTSAPDFGTQINGGTGLQTVNASSILLQGSGSGTNNIAWINANGGGGQVINTGDLTLAGGAGADATARLTAVALAVGSPTQTINASGATTIQGGSGSGSYAWIGRASSPVDIVLNGTGDITISGGPGSGALAGIGVVQAGAGGNVTINGGTNVTLNKGATGAMADARIGSIDGGGTLIVKSGQNAFGNLALNDGLIFTTGDVTLRSGNSGSITQGAGGVITANKLLADAGSGSVLMNTATNMVNVLAGRARNEFLFKNGQALTIGSVNSVDGILVDSTSGPVNISVEVTGSGLLTVNNDVKATTSGSNEAATVTLVSGAGGITVNGATVRAQAGGGDSSGGEAIVTLRTAGAIDINGGARVEARGGDPSCCSWAGGNATVRLVAPGGITVRQGSGVEARGGRAGSSGGSQGGHATVELCAGTYTTGCDASTSTGGIVISNSYVAGRGGSASSSGRGGNAQVALTAGSGGIQIAGMASTPFSFGSSMSSGTILALGGFGDRGGGTATVTLNTTGGIAVAVGDANSALIAAIGGNASFASFESTPAHATVSLAAPGGITVSNNSTVAALGGQVSSVTGRGGEATIDLCAGTLSLGLCTVSTNGGITLAGSALLAMGGFGPSGGGDTIVRLNAGDGGISGVGISISGLGDVPSFGRGEPLRTAIHAQAGGGNGGNGGYASVALDSTGGSISVSGGATIAATGGAGNRNSPICSGCFTVDGGEGYVSVYADALDVNTGGKIEATGGAGNLNGGPGTVYVNANTGNITVNGGVIRATGGPALGNPSACAPYDYYCGYGGDASIAMYAYGSGSLNVSNGSLLQALGGTGTNTYDYYGSGDAWIYLYSAGSGINVSDSTIQALGGSGTNFGGYASVSLQAYGPGGLDVSNSVIEATAGGGQLGTDNAYVSLYAGTSAPVMISSGSTVKADGAEGSIYINGSAGVTIANSTLSALGSSPASCCWSAQIDIGGGSGAIDTTNSTLSALGVNGGGGVSGQINLNAPGNITLGLLATDPAGNVSVNTSGGSITDGNSGLNIQSPYASLYAASGIGSIGDPLETLVGQIYLSSGGGEIGIINAGSLTLDSLTFNGTTATVGTTVNLSLGSGSFTATGNLGLGANGIMTVNKNVYASGDLLLQAGTLNITSEATVQGSNVDLIGGTVTVDSATALASNLMSVSAGTLNVSGGTLQGADVDMTIGRLINVSGGGKIVSDFVTTINILFPTLSMGGFMVNTTANVVDPLDSTTGFFIAGTAPVNQVTSLTFPGFNVTYGVSELPPAVQQAVNQVIAVTNEQTTVTSTEEEDDKNKETVASSDTTQKEGEKDKKGLPVCK